MMGSGSGGPPADKGGATVDDELRPWKSPYEGWTEGVEEGLGESTEVLGGHVSGDCLTSCCLVTGHHKK